MSNTGKLVILGAIAASLTIGAVQFASGHDLTGGRLDVAPGNVVNRSAKADRAQLQPSASQTKTISLRLSQFTDTSFLLRVPAAPAPATDVARGSAGNSAPTSNLIQSDGAKPDAMKRPVACEPSVSVLTEIAKSLQAGRCVT